MGNPPVAQLVERSTYTRLVGGSTPSGRTWKTKNFGSKQNVSGGAGILPPGRVDSSHLPIVRV